MIGTAAAERVKILVALAERVEKIGEARNFGVRAGAELAGPLVEGGGFLRAQRAVGTKRGEHARGQAGGSGFVVVFEGVGGIVRGAHGADAKFFQDSVGRELAGRELRVGLLPYFRGGGLVEQTVHAEIAQEFEMRPVVERIAQRVRDGPRPGQEFVVGLGVAGAIFFATPFARMARHL